MSKQNEMKIGEKVLPIIRTPINGSELRKHVIDGKLDVIVPVELGNLIDAGGIDSFNELIDESIMSDGAAMLGDMSYEVVGHESYGSEGIVLIRVTCGEVEFFDDEDEHDEDE